ncbi:hypothetical protein BamIOP4010DRAFT_5760 [Burkholderia ambifaria IOP40-10]|uniref:Uncharacterized protein n=1 Tax=Burkholderia ambifaria IOP40-10 TaxID=396596 RepID=B1FNZ9_9BURK|nr:hypothetical protein BamIOP4010DRAFT_5760 [Burkholderia ambifaria IOP40-10]
MKVNNLYRRKSLSSWSSRVVYGLKWIGSRNIPKFDW